MFLLLIKKLETFQFCKLIGPQALIVLCSIIPIAINEPNFITDSPNVNPGLQRRTTTEHFIFGVTHCYQHIPCSICTLCSLGILPWNTIKCPVSCHTYYVLSSMPTSLSLLIPSSIICPNNSCILPTMRHHFFHDSRNHPYSKFTPSPGIFSKFKSYISVGPSQINKFFLIQLYALDLWSSTFRFQSTDTHLVLEGTCWQDLAAPLKNSAFSPSSFPEHPQLGYGQLSPGYGLRVKEKRWGHVLSRTSPLRLSSTTGEGKQVVALNREGWVTSTGSEDSEESRESKSWEVLIQVSPFVVLGSYIFPTRTLPIAKQICLIGWLTLWHLATVLIKSYFTFLPLPSSALPLLSMRLLFSFHWGRLALS